MRPFGRWRADGATRQACGEEGEGPRPWGLEIFKTSFLFLKSCIFLTTDINYVWAHEQNPGYAAAVQQVRILREPSQSDGGARSPRAAKGARARGERRDRPTRETNEILIAFNASGCPRREARHTRSGEAVAFYRRRRCNSCCGYERDGRRARRKGHGVIIIVVIKMIIVVVIITILARQFSGPPPLRTTIVPFVLSCYYPFLKLRACNSISLFPHTALYTLRRQPKGLFSKNRLSSEH